MEIKTISIESVRGISDQRRDISVGYRGLIIFGPNGAGKSSIIDAIEIATRGKSSLFAEDRQGVNWATGAPHVAGGDQLTEIALTHHGALHVLKWPKPEPVEDTDLQSWKSAAEAATFVLRRHMLLEFVTSQPAPRYRALEPFLDLTEFVALESSLANIRDEVSTVLGARQTLLDQRRQEIARTFNLSLDDPIREQEIRDQTNRGLQDHGILPIIDWSNVTDKIIDVDGRITGTKPDPRIAGLNLLLERLKMLPLVASWTAEIANLKQAADEYDKLVVVKKDEWLAIWLQEGRDHLADSTEDICYFCESAIEREKVLARLKSRIESNAIVLQAQRLRKQRSEHLRGSIYTAIGKYKEFINEWAKCFEDDKLVNYLLTLKWLEDLDQILIDKNINASAFQSVMARIAQCVSSHDDASARIQRELPTSGPDKGYQELLVLRRHLEALHRTIPGWRQLSNQVDAGTAILNHANLILLHAENARKQTVEGIVNELGDQANRYYELTHPEEQIGNSKLKIRKAVSGSVELEAEFHGIIENPLLHFSESHLDTLGLAYFLAIRRKEAEKNPSFKLLMLDDVLHSVDADHRVRLARLLAREFSDHQIIVTTHDELFYDRLCRELGSEASRLWISGWGLKTGPVAGPSETAWDTVLLPESRSSLQTKDIGSRAGIVFEELLKVICEKLRVPVPIKLSMGYTNQDLWEPLRSRLSSRATDATVHGDLIKELDGSTWIRNWTSHDRSDVSIPVQLAEAHALANLVGALYHSLWCSTCKNPVVRQITEDWVCPCGSLKYQKERKR